MGERYRGAARVGRDEEWYKEQLEIGAHRYDGVHGEKGQEFDSDFSNPLGENLERTRVWREGAWIYYRPGGPTQGWWLRGEWGAAHDRFGDGAFTNLLGLASVDSGQPNPRGGNFFNQEDPTPVTVSGWYAATGYRLSKSIFNSDLAKGGELDRMLSNLEFAARYETYQNVSTEDLIEPDRHTDQFATNVITMGMNYYIKGRGTTKIQANYLIVDDPASAIRAFREVKNNVFVVNFQVAF